jgi:carbonic anhydrase
MKTYEQLLLENKSGQAEMLKIDPSILKTFELQTPEYLWIGCSDSRVPANQITGTQPGKFCSSQYCQYGCQHRFKCS